MASKQLVDMQVQRSLNDAKEYEAAISAAGFGLFNVIVIFLVLFAAMALYFSTISISFVLPVAECKLNITISDKGMLKGMVSTGMLIGAVPWALISDAYGRKIVLIVGHLLDFVFSVGCALSQNKESIYAFKFLSGCCVVGSFAAVVSYSSEIHSNKYRMRIVFVTGMLINVASLIMPGLAALILPLNMDAEFWGMSFESWHFFIFICAFPALFAGIGFIFMPESPKYCISKMRQAEAYKTFALIYHLNKFKPKSEYPIEPPPESEQSETTDHHKRVSCKKRCSRMWLQIKPMFEKRNLLYVATVCMLDFCLFMSQNTFHQWMPDLFADMDDLLNRGEVVESFCDILQKYNTKDHHKRECVVNTHAYLYNFPSKGASFIAYLIAFFLVQKVGGKIVLCGSLMISSLVIALLALAPNPASIVTVLSIYLALENVSATSIINTSVLLFPTQIRTTVISLTWTFGRIGSIIGNNVLAVFLKNNYCMMIIVCADITVIVAYVLSLLLPNPSNIPFQ